MGKDNPHTTVAIKEIIIACVGISIPPKISPLIKGKTSHLKNGILI